MAKKPPQNLPLTKLLSTEEVVTRMATAGLTDLNTRWIKSQSDRGNIPYVVVARKRRYRQDFIEQLIKHWCDAAA